MNSATDNPMVFAETGEILSGGNFHGQPVAIAADFLAIAAAELGAISERRTERLVNPALSGLPAFLAREGGLHSGLMMAHVTAAALASENKSLAHPASVDSIPTSAGKEDHVSMGPTAARKAARVGRQHRPRPRRRAPRRLPGPRVPAAPALLAAARGRASRACASRCRPTGRTASSAPEIEALAAPPARRARSSTRPSRPAVRWSRCPTIARLRRAPWLAGALLLALAARPRRARSAYCARLEPLAALLAGLGAALLLALRRGSSGSGSAGPSRRPQPRGRPRAASASSRAARATATLTISTKDDDGDKPRWVM